MFNSNEIVVTKTKKVKSKIDIFVEKRANDWHASFDKKGLYWDCGETRNEAMGNLIITWGKKFGINIKN